MDTARIMGEIEADLNECFNRLPEKHYDNWSQMPLIAPTERRHLDDGAWRMDIPNETMTHKGVPRFVVDGSRSRLYGLLPRVSHRFIAHKEHDGSTQVVFFDKWDPKRSGKHVHYEHPVITPPENALFKLEQRPLIEYPRLVRVLGEMTDIVRRHIETTI